MITHVMTTTLHNKTVIAIAGAKGSGKSTLATGLAERHGYGTIAFADPLKAMLSDKYQMKPCFFYDPELKNVDIESLGTSPRVMMQQFGTEFVRHMDPLFWATHLLIDMSFMPEDVVIVHDLRMLNEAQALMDHTNVIFIKVVRPNVEGVKDNHSTENEFERIKFDLEVENSSDIVTMVNKVEDYLSTLKYWGPE